MGPAEAEAMISIVGMITGIIIMTVVSIAGAKVLTGPIGQALGRRIAGKTALPDPELLNEMANLRAEIDQVHQRLAETEERLDFSERLLAQRTSEPAERSS